MFCNFCGAQLPDGTKFCNICGKSLSPAQSAAQQPAFNPQQPQAPIQQTPADYPQQPMGYPLPVTPVMTQPKKKSKAPIIIAVIFIVIAAIVVISVVTNTSKTIEHGVIDGNVYTNESIGIKFTKPDAWVFSSDEELAEMNEDSVSASDYSDLAKLVRAKDCVFEMSASSPLGSNASIMIEDISARPSISTESYAEIVIDNISKENPIGCDVGEITEKEIDGQTFTVVELKITSFSLDSPSVAKRLYIKKHGNYMIGIITASFSDSSLNEIENMISTIS